MFRLCGLSRIFAGCGGKDPWNDDPTGCAEVAQIICKGILWGKGDSLSAFTETDKYLLQADSSKEFHVLVDGYGNQ